MKINFKKLLPTNLIGGLVILGITLILLFVLLAISDSELEKTAIFALNEAAEDKQHQINIEFDNAKNSVISIAETLLEYPLEDEELQNFLYRKKELYNFENLYVVNPTLQGVSQDGTEKDFSLLINDSTYFKYEIGVAQVSYPVEDEETQVNSLYFYTPIEGNGYIFAEYSLEKINESLEQEVGDFGYALFTDSTGRDFYISEVTFLQDNEIGDYNFDNTSQSIDEVIANLSNHEGGSIAYELNGTKMVAVYKPINANNWSLVIAVGKNIYINNIRVMSTLLIIFLLSVFAGLMFFTLAMYNAKKTLEKVAYYDKLTGMPNLAKFKNDVYEILKNNPDKQYVVVKFDILNFKAINEMYGFEIGNKVLCAFSECANVAKSRVKSFMAARTGADEFMMFATDGVLEHIHDFIPRYEKSIKMLTPEIENHYLVFKYGRYIIEKNYTDVDEILSRAGIAHRLAKARTDTNICDFDIDMKNNLLNKVEITNKMEAALENEEFVAYLQPKVDLKTGKTSSAEALVRWIEPDGKINFPGSFIPIFEGNGFIVKLDNYILNSVCKTLVAWQDKGFEIVPVSVNFSRKHFINPDFINNLIKIVDSYNIDRKYIEIELTETIVLDNEDAIEELLLKIKNAGFKVSIDDFGSGYSSLGLLKDLDVDTLKLDRSFFINNNNKIKGELVVDAIINLAHGLGMDIVAEGVEEAHQVEFLKRIGCDVAQGYYFEKPISLAEFEKKHLQKN